METEEIVGEILKRYKNAEEKDLSCADCLMSKKERCVLIEIDEKTYSVTRNELADDPATDDELANKIWYWIT